MKILFSGGGTMGSVTPLLAVAETIKEQQPKAEFLWLTTKNGVENAVLRSYNQPIKPIFSGKLRRYFSISNFTDLFLLSLGFLQSMLIIWSFKPKVMVSAGGYVAVPVAWACFFCRVPVVIHQQDFLPGLANKLMAKLANKITVNFEKSLQDFPVSKTVLLGNPVRAELFLGDKEKALAFFKLVPELPTVLVIGGGTGALGLNQLLLKALPALVSHCQVIHLTGGKISSNFSNPNYHPYEFLTGELKDAYAVSDLIVCRAGMGTLSEIAALAKPAIIIAMPKSHQELNAAYFLKNNAAALLPEDGLTGDDLYRAIIDILDDEPLRQNYARNLLKINSSQAGKKMAEIILSYAGN